MFKISQSEVFEGFKTRIGFKQNKIETKIESIFMNDNTQTKQFLKELFEFIAELKRIFGDGFQWTDSLAVAGLTPKVLSLLMQINSVKSEAPNLSKEQIKLLTGEFSAVGLSIFWTDNKEENEKYGIENLKVLIQELTDLINESIKALKDGLTVSDMQYLPSVITSLIDIINASARAFEEAKHLSAVKVSELLVLMLGRIFFIIG